MPDIFTSKPAGPTIGQTPGGGVPTGGPYGPAVMPPMQAPPIVNPAGTGGNGTDWASLLGLGASAIGSIYGAYSQNKTNDANTASQMAQLAMLNARQAQVTQGAQSMMQQGQNPYSTMLMQMLSGARPGGVGMQPGMPTGTPIIPNYVNPSYVGAQPMPGINTPVSGPWDTPAVQPPLGGFVSHVDDQGRVLSDPAWAQYQQAYAGPALHPTDPAYMAAWNAARGTPGASGASPASNPNMHPSQIDPVTGVSYVPGQGNIWDQTVAAGGQIPSALGGNGAMQQLMQLPAFTAPSAIGTQAMNPGQDPYLQMMRANTNTQNDIMGSGNPFNTTDLFGALDTKNTQDLSKQLADLSGTYGSFGQRLGSSAMNAQSNLRSTFLTNANAQRQQLAMQAYTDAQNRRLQALGIGAGREAQVGSQQLAQSGQQLGAQQFNATQQQNWNQFMLGGLTQANSMQQAQQGQNMGLLSLIAGLPMGNPVVSQPSATGGAIGDIGQLLMMYRLLGQV